MIIYVAWPTCNLARSNKTAAVWLSMGYKVAIATEAPAEEVCTAVASVPPLRIKAYEGYYPAMNALALPLVQHFRADIVIAGGDGILPFTLMRANDVGQVFAKKFPNSFGVMQPTAGSRWKPTGSGQGTQAWAQHRMHATPFNDERCESPWLGREFIRGVNGANGPYCGGYRQYFGDVELHDVAAMMGCLWRCPSVHQPSEHWAREHGPEMLPYQRHNFERDYEKDYALFRVRKSKRYPRPSEAEPNVDFGDRKLLLPGDF